MQYIQDLGIKVYFASVAHPRSNGQAERANAEVLRGLRTKTFDKLRKSGRRWIDELPAVLWSIRTTPNRATGETPFALVYGAEAVLPTELIYGSSRVLAYNELEQEQLRHDDATLLEEDRLRAAVRAARYQQALRRYHSRKVHARSLEEGDLILQRSIGQEFQQVDAEVGRPLSGNTSHQAWRSLPGDRRCYSNEHLLEHRTSLQVLPIRRGCPPPASHLLYKPCRQGM